MLSDLNVDKAVAPNGKMRKSVWRYDFFLSFIDRNDLEKVWKQEQSVSHGAFTLKKHPALHCKTAENRAKMFKINKMAKQITF